MLKLEKLAQEYNFDFGFVTDFTDEITFDKTIASRLAVTATNPLQVLPECKTVVVLAFKHNVYLNSNVASFACGEDYHTRVNVIMDEVKKLFSNSISMVDSDVLNERYFAAKSGMGFIGKNSMFISEKFGSFCNLGLILTSDYIKSSVGVKNKCGRCTKCIDQCPVSAIEPFSINCNLCISERLQDRHNLNFDNLGTNVYGCDICQLCCPHNLINLNNNDLSCKIDLIRDLDISKKQFNEKYHGSSFYWLGYRTFKRNVHIAYINETNDLTKLELLNSESDYIKTAIETLMEGK